MAKSINKFAINEVVASTGIVVESDVFNDSAIKFAVENGPGSFEVYSKLVEDEEWSLLSSYNGSGETIIDVRLVKYLRVVATSSNYKLIAVGFDNV